MENDFEDYSINIESDVLYQDFDDVDLYGTKTSEENFDTFGNDIDFE